MDMLKKDKDNINEILYNAMNYANTFYSTLNDRPVSSQHSLFPKEKLPEMGVGAIEALKMFSTHYDKGISGSNGARYLGFVTGGATPAAIAGDWLTSIFDQNVSTTNSSVASLIEEQTINMLKELFSLDNEYSGAFVSGATMSNFVGLAQARQWIAKASGVNISIEGLYNVLPIKVISGKAHSSIYKACSMLGIGKKSILSVSCQNDREAVDIHSLEEILINQKGSPCIIVANAGTVNTGDFDDLNAISQLKKKYNFWLHIDAAFGGFAACSPKYKSLMNGINSADSITIDTHKWLNVPYDSGIQFTKHKNIQLEVFENNAAYLENSNDTMDYCNLTPENSRRFRALPAWFTLKSYGKSEYQRIIERNIDLAKQLGDRIKNSEHLSLLSQVHLNIVCFTLNSEKITNEEVLFFLEKVNSKGKVFLTQTHYKEHTAIRAAFSNWDTHQKDFEIIWAALMEEFS